MRVKPAKRARCEAALTDEAIANLCGYSTATVHRVRRSLRKAKMFSRTRVRCADGLATVERSCAALRVKAPKGSAASVPPESLAEAVASDAARRDATADHTVAPAVDHWGADARARADAVLSRIAGEPARHADARLTVAEQITVMPAGWVQPAGVGGYPWARQARR
jgi:hypothetical protein